jgi:hypothetical protein
MGYKRHAGSYTRTTLTGELERLCAGCGAWKARTREHWHANRSAPDGLQNWCKVCMCRLNTAEYRMARAAAMAEYTPDPWAIYRYPCLPALFAELDADPRARRAMAR